MTPIEFVDFDGDSTPNQPYIEVNTAMHQQIRIVGPDLREYVVCGYYCDEGRMVLELKEEETK